MASIKSYSSSAPNLVQGTSGGESPQHGQRRRHNFGDRVYKLSPEETPFFAYLSAVGKAPTDDPVFRVLEDRAPTKWADRTFNLVTSSGDKLKIQENDATDLRWEYDAGGNGYPADEGAGLYDLPVSAAAKAELIPGMLVQLLKWNAETPYQVTGRISKINSGNSIQITTVEQYGGDADTEITSAADNEWTFQVIGSAFGEGSGSPESFGYDMEDTVGYTQIFKTSAYMSNTARATVLRGYASEWDRIWSMKLREHKVDIERAMLFNNKGRIDNVQYTDGIIGHIIKSGATWESNDANALAYVSGKPFVRNVDTGSNEVVYDRFLKDFEVIFAPERGGASEKFCMGSMAVVTYMNQLKSGFLSDSTDSNQHYNLNFASLDGGLGHKVMKVDTVHGSLSIVKNPLLKGIGKSMMVGVDLGSVSYRPLVGNGLNRDTYIETNVQSPDEDSRKDQILTEAGLEVCLPESHFIYNFVSGSKPIG
jgi:hypothetical protein